MKSGEKQSKQRRSPAPKGPPATLVGIVVVFVLVVVGGAIYLMWPKPLPASPIAGEIPGEKGSPTAKVTITEYSDYQ